MIKTFDNVIIAEQKQNGMVCLATQCSIDRLPSIIELSKNWNGPISTAIYAAGEELYYLQGRFIFEHLLSIQSHLDINSS